MENILNKSDKEILQEAEKLRVGYALKRTLRYATTRDTNIHNESVAEHVFALIVLAHYFLRHEPLGASLDAAKLHSILLFHDFGEIKHGDVVTYNKTLEDEERERQAAQEIFDSLPAPLSDIGREHWHDYEEGTSPEARFACALDKVEPIFELLDPINERSLKRLKTTYEMHLNNKLSSVEEYPVMSRFVHVLSLDMLTRDVFWT